MCELAGKGNVSEMIWFCKNLDLQGFGKRLKDVRDRYDTMMEKIMKEHEEARKKKELKDDGIKDVLDILLDIYEEENSEIKMTRENIKGFITGGNGRAIGLV
ncbi:3,9-dihydroxypterocarpan 6a-monooxygenase [Fagus crenata]